MDKLLLASNDTGIKVVALSGGVAANSGLREAIHSVKDWKTYVPAMELCTDNAAMVALAGYFKLTESNLGDLNATPYARFGGCE
jgi:N6-L-threonylcarbamoyladenine synthase